MLMMLHSGEGSIYCFCPAYTSQRNKKAVLSVNHPEELITGDIQYDTDFYQS